MGQHHEFTCPNCKYTCEVSGREDFGKQGHRTQTFACKNCKIVQDRLIGRTQNISRKLIPVPVQTPFQKFISKFTGDKKFNEQKLRYKEFYEKSEDNYIPESEISCKNCRGKNMKIWDINCPKCETKMEITNFMTAMWD